MIEFADTMADFLSLRDVVHVCLRKAYRKGEAERMSPSYHVAIIQQQRVVCFWVAYEEGYIPVRLLVTARMKWFSRPSII